MPGERPASVLAQRPRMHFVSQSLSLSLVGGPDYSRFLLFDKSLNQILYCDYYVISRCMRRVGYPYCVVEVVSLLVASSALLPARSSAFIFLDLLIVFSFY